MVAWEAWTDCDGGLRTRQQIIKVQPEGDGAIQCPVLQYAEEVCVDCQLAWGDWSACEGGLRRRLQYVLVKPEGEGAEACGSLQDEEEGLCDVIISF